MERFQVSEKIFVGRGQPTEEDLQHLAAEGFASVIDLRQLGEGGERLSPPLEAAAAGRNGLRYAHIPVPTDRLEPDMLERVAAALESMPGPVLVHCASGKRAGTFAIASAAAADGLTGRTAVERIDAAGSAYGSDAMRAVVQRFVDRKTNRGRSGRTQAPSRRMPPAARRADRPTPDAINRRIAQDIDASIRWHAHHPDAIDRRLDELEREWDMERALQANVTTLALGGVLLGAIVDRRWLVLPAAMTAFLLQYTIQGRCPLVSIFRRMGVRTAAEIDRERYALKVLRGDFASVRAEAALARAGQTSTVVAQ
jgi:uncharacterized protein (TIGR01244 family)